MTSEYLNFRRIDPFSKHFTKFILIFILKKTHKAFVINMLQNIKCFFYPFLTPFVTKLEKTTGLKALKINTLKI